MSQYKKITTGTLALIVTLLCLRADGWQVIFVESALAQGSVAAPGANMLTGISELAIFIATGMQMLAFIIFSFLQVFLDPLFIVDLVGSSGLRNIWKYSRDIMNIIFAFMLIFAGIYTVVIGSEQGSSFIKAKYKKFILAVILVNFSWFFPRVILDVANVLTATIYQLPAGISGGQVECKLPPKDPKDPSTAEDCQVIADIKYFSGCNPPPDVLDADGDPIPGKKTEYVEKGVVCILYAPWEKDTNTSYGMLNGLVVNYGKLGQLLRVLKPGGATTVSGTAAQRFKQTMLFLMHIVFILVLMTMLFLPLAAMLVVFLIRIPIMWVTMAFMPFMFLGFVIGDKMANFDSMKIFEHYVKAAFLPAAIAVPFAAGFLILTEITQIACPAIAGPLCSNTGPLLHNVNTLWGILMLLIAFFVIWFGFWAALSIDQIYVKVTSGIKSFGESVGKTALKLPLSTPIPIGGGKKMSLLGIDDAINSINSALSSGMGAKQAFKQAMAGGGKKSDETVAKILNAPKSTLNTSLEKIITEIGKANGGTVKTKSNLDVQINSIYSKHQAEIQKEQPGMTESEFRDAFKRNSRVFRNLKNLK
ncbi:hypothetical protein CL635_02340 [bacterium]|jgi:hypothetical protein|nr:hypothetical protein [bacterium]|tara:strand:+ start:3245 stop:5011 length:1767 start_codon:yes stop_codon:yes gene_type:complete